MKKWNVFVVIGASINVEVEAETEEEAKELAMGIAETPCLCYQCSDGLDLGDPIEAPWADEI